MRTFFGPVVVLAALVSACAGGAETDTRTSTLDTTGTDTGTGDTSTTSPTTTSPTTTTTTSTTTGEPCDMSECEGECVDLETSADHCGGCGLGCFGGECIAGECQVAQLAANKGRLFMVQVDDEHVYYGGDGVFIGRLSKDGGEDVVIEDGSEVCAESVMTPSALLWSSDAALGTRGCIKPDCLGGVLQFYDGPGRTTLAYNELYGRLYWSHSGDIFQRDWPGGSLEMLVDGAGDVLEIETDDTHLYWLVENAQEQQLIRRIDILGEEPAVTLVGPRDGIVAIAVGPTRLYWSEAQVVYSEPFETLGEVQPVPFGQAPGPIRDLIADDTHLYWAAAEGGGEGYIERCDLEVCTVPERLDEPLRPWSLALDDEAVFWVTETGTVAGLRK